MHLPTPQFSRLVAVLAFDVNSSSLDSMFIAWDHIATRYLNRLQHDRVAAGKIESIRLLAVHDAVLSVLGPGAGFLFSESSTGTSLAAALAATAQASHDILVNAFIDPSDIADLDDTLEESLDLIDDYLEKSVGSATGSASAATFLQAFGPLAPSRTLHGIAPGNNRFSPAPIRASRQYHDVALGRFALQRSA